MKMKKRVMKLERCVREVARLMVELRAQGT